MEIESSIYGRVMKLYGANVAANYPTITDYFNAFQNAAYLRDINAGFIRKSSLLPLQTGVFLFDEDGVFQIRTANTFDEIITDWQFMPLLYKTNNYSGKVPIDQYLGLFPNRISLDNYGYNTFFITDDDVDGVQVFKANCDVSGSPLASRGFNKNTGAEQDSFYISTTVMGDGDEYPRLTWLSWYFINDNVETLNGVYYSSYGLATSSMYDSVYFPLGSSHTIHYEDLIDFKEDFNPTDDDPYDDDDGEGGGGGSQPGGGGGSHDDSSDDIPFPDLPSLSAVATGFITLYNPSLSQLQALANYMWSSRFDIATYKKLFADPMTCILGLSMIPVSIPDGTIKNVTIGNIESDVSMTSAAQQYVEVDCGTLNIEEFWGAYMDYSPYTKIELFLPYCGTHPLNVDEVMGKTMHIKYHVDILSGSCVAYVKCGNSVLYTFQGNCAASIPITGNDWTNVINGSIQLAASVGEMIASGGASAPESLTNAASTLINNIKPDVEKSGAIGSMGGMLAIQKPYVIITRPNLARPKFQNKFMGYPSFITEAISSLSGYTEMEVTHLSGSSATDEEIEEIERLLKEGVFL